MADNEVLSIVLLKFGGFDNIVCTKTLRRRLENGHVRVAVKACGVNFSDIFTWHGVRTMYNRQPPFVMGLECSGSIAAKADDVQELEVGDRVLCCNFLYEMWSEEVCVPVENCFKIPDGMTYEEAAAFPINYLTAYFAVIDFGHLREGQTLYLESAGGGVACAAIQLAKTVENVTIIGSASPSKHEAALKNGLKHCFDSRSEDSVKEIRKMYPEGVDVIVCMNCGDDVDKNKQLLKPLGRLILIGAANALSGERKQILQILKIMWKTKNISPLDLLNENHSVCGLNLATLWENDLQRVRSSLGHLLAMYEKGLVKPIIDSVWPFSQVTKGIARLLERKNVGKVILVPKMENDESVASTSDEGTANCTQD